MSIYEYDEEAHMQMLREDSYADGVEYGRKEGHKEGLAEGQKNGAAKTLVNSVESITSMLHVNIEKACQILRITTSDYLTAKKLLEEQSSATAD